MDFLWRFGSNEQLHDPDAGDYATNGRVRFYLECRASAFACWRPVPPLLVRCRPDMHDVRGLQGRCRRAAPHWSGAPRSGSHLRHRHVVRGVCDHRQAFTRWRQVADFGSVRKTCDSDLPDRAGRPIGQQHLWLWIYYGSLAGVARTSAPSRESASRDFPQCGHERSSANGFVREEFGHISLRGIAAVHPLPPAADVPPCYFFQRHLGVRRMNVRRVRRGAR